MRVFTRSPTSLQSKGTNRSKQRRERGQSGGGGDEPLSGEGGEIVLNADGRCHERAGIFRTASQKSPGITHAILKAKQRELRVGFPETMGLRVHRSIIFMSGPRVGSSGGGEVAGGMGLEHSAVGRDGGVVERCTGARRNRRKIPEAILSPHEDRGQRRSVHHPHLERAVADDRPCQRFANAVSAVP